MRFVIILIFVFFGLPIKRGNMYNKDLIFGPLYFRAHNPTTTSVGHELQSHVFLTVFQLFTELLLVENNNIT